MFKSFKKETLPIGIPSESSFVIGNAAQLLLLTPEERTALDSFPWVLCLNFFPLHWELVNFRPTVYVVGDNMDSGCVNLARNFLDAIMKSKNLLERLKHIFFGVGEQEDTIRELVGRSGICQTNVQVHFYKRKENFLGPIAKTLDEVIFHFASTLTDLINLAWLLNPGNEIRILGCPRANHYQYFYDASTIEFGPEPARRIWTGIDFLRVKHLLPLIDCNHHHDFPHPYFFPRKGLLEP